MKEFQDLIENTLCRDEKFQGKIFSVHVDQVTLPNGKTASREVVEHCDGVAVLPIDSAGNVLMVRQYRYVFAKPLLEIPAGKLDAGEDPAAGALRELREETGAVPETFLSLGRILPSPGCFSETLHLYLAQGLRMEDQQLDADEFLNVERVPFAEALQRCMDGDLEDAKTVAAILKAKLLFNL